MTTETKKTEYTFDAAGGSLGRLATEVATALRGKNTPAFQPHIAPEVTVTVNNVAQLDLNASQLAKEYKRFSGYPGGLTHESREHTIARKGYGDIFSKAVYGMLPGNKLRAVMMKNLIINE